MIDREDYWDGIEPLRPGLVVKYVGSQNSEFYKLPSTNTLLTLIAEDIQMGFNPVWICRWYDSAGRVNLVPLLPKVLGRAKEPVDSRTVQVAANYSDLTGKDLDLNSLQTAIDFLLHPVQTQPHSEKEDKEHFAEITIHTSSDFPTLESVSFPVTVKVSEEEYKIYPEMDGISILGSILNMLPGADKNFKLENNKFYLFYLNEEVTYKEQ